MTRLRLELETQNEIILYISWLFVIYFFFSWIIQRWTDSHMVVEQNLLSDQFLSDGVCTPVGQAEF